MKRIPLLLFVLLPLIYGYTCNNRTQKTKTNLKVCSFNIRLDNPRDGFNRWENRRENVVAFLAIEKPDIIGFQEVRGSQLEYLEKGLSGYSRAGVGREDGANKGEYTPIFYRNDRYTLLNSGNFWLSETPEVPSLGWDAKFRRLCTYVILKDNESEEEIHVYNTHFSHVGSESRLLCFHGSLVACHIDILSFFQPASDWRLHGILG